MEASKTTCSQRSLSSNEYLRTDASPTERPFPMTIEYGRKRPLVLKTILQLSEQEDNMGNSFQPSLEDLVFIFGDTPLRIDRTTHYLRQKGLLERIFVNVMDESVPMTDILVCTPEGIQHLEKRQKQVTTWEEWQQVQERIQLLLQEPQLSFLPNLPRESFFQVREIVRLMVPLLPPLALLDRHFIEKIAAYDKGKELSHGELSIQVLGFIDALLRLQGDYLPLATFQKIAILLEKKGVTVDLTKKSLYPHIKIGARLFGSAGTRFYHRAVLKAIHHYCHAFKIDSQTKSRIAKLPKLFQQRGFISPDPEARALGFIGYVVKGLFSEANRSRYPLPPSLWFAGRDQMYRISHAIRQTSSGSGRSK